MDLESILRERGVPYTKSGNLIRCEIPLPDGRTQLAFLDPDADDFVGMRDHDFTSVIGPAADPAKVKQACVAVGGMKRGGIIIRQDLILLKFEVPEIVDAEVAFQHLLGLCVTADRMEKELFGGDAW